MKFAVLQENPIVSPKNVADDLENILKGYGYIGGKIPYSQLDDHYQVLYEIPDKGAVLLVSVSELGETGISSFVSYIGFDEKQDFLEDLVKDVDELAYSYHMLDSTSGDKVRIISDTYSKRAN